MTVKEHQMTFSDIDPLNSTWPTIESALVRSRCNMNGLEVYACYDEGDCVVVLSCHLDPARAKDWTIESEESYIQLVGRAMIYGRVAPASIRHYAGEKSFVYATELSMREDRNEI